MYSTCHYKDLDEGSDKLHHERRPASFHCNARWDTREPPNPAHLLSSEVVGCEVASATRWRIDLGVIETGTKGIVLVAVFNR